MFEFVRKHNKIMMFVMFLLIVPAFVLVGVDGYSRSNESGATVAKIASYSITQTEWDTAHKNEVDRLRASRPELDAKMMDSPEARYATAAPPCHTARPCLCPCSSRRGAASSRGPRHRRAARHCSRPAPPAETVHGLVQTAPQ